MKVKVCGMKYPQNISALVEQSIDMIGFIFYPKSPRYVSPQSTEEIREIKELTSKKGVKRVGVFVNEKAEAIYERVEEYGLDFVQLHGNETPEFCQQINQIVPVIKAFSVSEESDLERTGEYENRCVFFLFDTKTKDFGGSGKKFDWNILKSYASTTPFLLSGGISVSDVEALKNIEHPLLYGVDLNSRFEIEAGEKDISLLEQFIKEIKP